MEITTDKHPGGRPPKYTNPEEMQKVIDEYFKTCDAGKKVTVIRKGQPIEINRPIPKTVAGLTLAIGFSSRQSLLNYTGKSEFMDIIARAKLRIEVDNVEMGLIGVYESRMNALNLASNFGYSTKEQVEQVGGNARINIQFVTNRTAGRLTDLEARLAKYEALYGPIPAQITHQPIQALSGPESTGQDETHPKEAEHNQDQAPWPQ